MDKPGNFNPPLFSIANRPERSIYGKRDYTHNPAMLIQACHRTLNALRNESPRRPTKAGAFPIRGMEPARLAKMVAAVSVVRGLSVRHADEYPYVGWNDLSESLGLQSRTWLQAQVQELYQKVMSPQEYETTFGDRNNRRSYNFDAPFTLALGEELEQYGFSLKEAAAALVCNLSPQGHQWRLGQLAPLRAMQAEKQAQIQAQTADNLSVMRQILLRRQAADAGRGN